MNNYHLYNGLTDGSHLGNFVETTFASAYWKDKKGAYLDTNKIFLRVSGSASHADVVRKTDRDLIWADQASIMMQNDQEIICTGLTKTYIESAKFPNNTIVHYLSHKTPLCNRHGKVIGTFGLSFLIENVDSIIKALNEMNSIGYPISSNKLKNLESIFNKKPTFGLTQRQIDCLYYLVRGMTMKQIAAALNLSPKTVEHYLDSIKTKLNCYTRAKLIEKALKLSFIRDNL